MAVTEWLAGEQFWIRTADDVADRLPAGVDPADLPGPVLECARPDCDTLLGVEPEPDPRPRQAARQHAIDAHE